MNVTLSPELFETKIFQASFREKLKSARYYDYDYLNSFSAMDLKHYQYARAVKGVLAEFGFMGYLLEKDVDFVYDKKVDSRKYSPDIDFIIKPNNIKIDVKSGFSFWKKSALMKQGIDYVVVCSPLLEHKEGVYRKNNWLMLESYRRLFKLPITVNILGYIKADEYIKNNSQQLIPMEVRLHNIYE